jgi:hypothetical protein
VDRREIPLEGLLEWLDDRIAVSSEPTHRVLLLEIRRRLALLGLRERQLDELLGAIRPRKPDEDGGELWVIEGSVAARVIEEMERQG